MFVLRISWVTFSQGKPPVNPWVDRGLLYVVTLTVTRARSGRGKLPRNPWFVLFMDLSSRGRLDQWDNSQLLHGLCLSHSIDG